MRSLVRTLVTVSTLASAVPLAFAPPASAGVQEDPSIKTICSFSKTSNDDPIVFPGQPGASHSHDFFGNTAVDAFATNASMNAAATTCDIAEDLSAYWAPSLLVDGVRKVPDHIAAYYKVSGSDPSQVQPYPFGLRVVAGDSKATAAQGLSVTSWICLSDDDGEEKSAATEAVPTCATGQHLGLRVEFPECWDGSRLDSADHKGHMAYLVKSLGTCPESHPVLLPRLQQVVHYEGLRGGAGYTLASGGQYSGHADFVNLWEPGRLAELVSTCLNSGAVCRDPDPKVAGAQVPEGGTLEFLVSLEEPNPLDVSVSYATAADGSATSNVDYVATSGTLVIPAGRLSATVAVPTREDTMAEASELMHLDLFDPSDGAMIGRGTGQIDDDDTAPKIYAADATIAEPLDAPRSLMCELVLNAPSGTRVSVDYQTVNGTATAPADYAATSGTVEFPAGVTAKTVRITVNPDSTFGEGNETLFLQLSNPLSGTIGDGSATLQITDPVTVPRLKVSDVSASEGSTAAVVLTLDAPPSQPMAVSYSTASGSAASGSDFTARSGSVTFAPGVTTATVSVSTIEDVTSEAAETFTVVFSNLTGGTILDGIGRVTITDDDPLPQLRIDDVSVLEPTIGTRALRFTVTLSAAAGQSVTVRWATVNGTALAPGDYLSSSGTLKLPAGTTSKTITVTVNADGVTEAAETMKVLLSAPLGAVIADGTGTGTITA